MFKPNPGPGLASPPVVWRPRVYGRDIAMAAPKLSIVGIVLAAVTALALVPGTASAQINTADDLKSKCTVTSASPTFGTDTLGCAAYVSGGMSSLLALQEAIGRKVVCLPADATGEALRDAVTSYLREHPEATKVDAGTAMLLAYAKAFPCKKP
jgi:hypothetical protein